MDSAASRLTARVFTVDLEDSDAAPELRRQHLAAHLAWVERVMDRILVAGPRIEDGEMRASFYLVEASDEAAARALISEDPYWDAGVWRTMQVRSFAPVAGRWVGGKTW